MLRQHDPTQKLASEDCSKQATPSKSFFHLQMVDLLLLNIYCANSRDVKEKLINVKIDLKEPEATFGWFIIYGKYLKCIFFFHER